MSRVMPMASDKFFRLGMGFASCLNEYSWSDNSNAIVIISSRYIGRCVRWPLKDRVKVCTSGHVNTFKMHISRCAWRTYLNEAMHFLKKLWWKWFAHIYDLAWRWTRSLDNGSQLHLIHMTGPVHEDVDRIGIRDGGNTAIFLSFIAFPQRNLL